MEVCLGIVINGVHYEKAEPENGIQEIFEVEDISFVFDGFKITSLEDLHGIVLNNHQKELIEQYLEKTNPNYIMEN